MEENILAILADMHPEYDYAGSTDFIADGLLDSFDVIDLVDQLETRFGIKIAGTDVLPEHFASLAAIAALVTKSKK